MLRYRTAVLTLVPAALLVPVYLLAQPYAPQDRIRARAANANALAQTAAAQRQEAAQNLAATTNGRQVTLTGRIWDVSSYFTTAASGGAQPSIIGEPVATTAQQLAAQQQAASRMQGTSSTVGSPPSAFVGANEGTVPQGLPRSTVTGAVTSGTPQTTVTNQTTANLSGGNPNLAAPNPNAHTPIQGSPQNATAQGNNQLNTGVTGTGPVFIMQTNTGPVLLSQQVVPGTASTSVLQPTSGEVQVTGMLFERSGLRFMLVNANNTNAALQGPTNFGQSGTTAVGQPAGTNSGQSGTTAVGQPAGTNFGQSGTTAVGQPQGTNFGQSGTTDTTGGGNNTSGGR